MKIKPYQIIASGSQCFHTYYIVSSYNNLAEAKHHYKKDLDWFHTHGNKFLVDKFWGYHAIIKDGLIAA